MRFLTFATLTTLTCGLALAGDGPQTVTYITGNLDLAPNSGATLNVSGAKVMELNNGTSKVEVPYAGITRAELGEATEYSDEQPLYKVWALHKRFIGKRAVQQVTVDFKTASGETRSMTIEAEQSVAEDVLAAIEDRTAPAPQKAAWWGDSVWKTKRNEEAWGGAGTVAARE
jgi:hypothetical protein